MTMRLLAFLSSLLVVVALLLVATEAAEKADFRLRNDSDRKVKVSWVHPGTGERVFMVEFSEDAKNELQSFVGHSFEIEETGSCVETGNCLLTMVQMTKSPQQSFILEDTFQLVEVDDLSKVKKKGELPADQVLAKCRQRSKEKLETVAPDDDATRDEITQELRHCLKKGLASTMRKAKEEIHYHRNIRESIAIGMENFTCTNPDLESSPDVDTKEWTSAKDGKMRLVHLKLDRPASRIHVIENFASLEECDAVEDMVKGRLHRASTADGKGGTQVSENRKALQAGITPAWSKESEGDLVAQLSRRVYDYVNYALGLSIEEHGQEPLMSIQYFGRGYNDTSPDRYTPHCDGPCDGEPFLHGSRMATMVIYCDIPVKGGHTNFQNANVHVKPEIGNGIFFSYIDPVTNLTDKGLTQHSGCPVYEGEKKIVTQWVRYGVSKEVPHSAYNTLGVLRSETSD